MKNFAVYDLLLTDWLNQEDFGRRETAWMGESIITFKILTGWPREKVPLGIPRF